MFRLAKIWGVPIKVHWSFALLFVLIFYMATIRQMPHAQIMSFLFLVMVLFICVLLHELGHALAAKKLGIKATDIVLSPIGGLARLESMHNYPKKEIIIALAGPAVNFVIALVLFIYLYFIAAQSQHFDPYAALDFLSLTAVLYFLFFINTMLFLFNLIPAFPMDGGRVLRALLTLRMPVLKATFIASVTGRVLSMLFLIVAFYYRYYALIVISLFVYIMAVTEYHALKRKYASMANED